MNNRFILIKISKYIIKIRVKIRLKLLLFNIFFIYTDNIRLG